MGDTKIVIFKYCQELNVREYGVISSKLSQSVSLTLKDNCHFVTVCFAEVRQRRFPLKTELDYSFFVFFFTFS